MSYPQKAGHQQFGVILPVQYLRGLAAIMVVWFHSRSQVPSLERFFAEGGASGVDLFFTISGFIMVATSSKSNTGPMEFMRRRIVRIVPIYWFMTLLMVTLALVAPSLFKTLIVTPEALLQSLLFIPHFSNSFPDHAWPLLVPGWTLNYEMFFYAMFALSLVAPSKIRLGVLTIAFSALVMAGFLFGPFTSAIGQTYTNPILMEFVAGALIGAAWLRGWIRPSFFAAVLMAIAGFALLMSPVHFWGISFKICGSSLLLLAALSPKLANWKNALLESIGNASYSLYLTHLFTLGIIRVAWGKLSLNEPTPLTATMFMCTAIIGSTLVGILIFNFLEKPLLQLFSKKRAPVDSLAAEYKK